MRQTAGMILIAILFICGLLLAISDGPIWPVPNIIGVFFFAMIIPVAHFTDPEGLEVGNGR